MKWLILTVMFDTGLKDISKHYQDTVYIKASDIHEIIGEKPYKRGNVTLCLFSTREYYRYYKGTCKELINKINFTRKQ